MLLFHSNLFCCFPDILQQSKDVTGPLTLVNISFGVALLLCLVYILIKGYPVIVKQLHARRRVKVRMEELSRLLSDVGITMRDGGEDIDDEQTEENESDTHRNH